MGEITDCGPLEGLLVGSGKLPQAVRLYNLGKEGKQRTVMPWWSLVEKCQTGLTEICAHLCSRILSPRGPGSQSVPWPWQ